jgi:hypothetical protein
MVTKSKKEGSGKKRKIKVLQLNKETVKNLTPDQAKGVKGASLTHATGNITCICFQTGK